MSGVCYQRTTARRDNTRIDETELITCRHISTGGKTCPCLQNRDLLNKTIKIPRIHIGSLHETEEHQTEERCESRRQQSTRQLPS